MVSDIALQVFLTNTVDDVTPGKNSRMESTSSLKKFSKNGLFKSFGFTKMERSYGAFTYEKPIEAFGIRRSPLKSGCIVGIFFKLS